MGQIALGWEEWIGIPYLGLPAIKAKIDTGARTSALHAFAIEPFGKESEPYVHFGVHPIPERPDIEIFCSAQVIDRRPVTSSSGEQELRYFIKVPVQIGDRDLPIEISLTNRGAMQYRMLLGRRAIGEDMIVDPNRSCLQHVLSPELYDELPKAKPVPRTLRIALLTREPDNYTNRRIMEAAEASGHVCEVINTTRCYMNINALAPEIHYDGKVLPRFDAVIPRIGAGVTSYGMAVVRQFELMGAYCVNNATAIGASRDKLLAHQLLAQRRIGMPVTAFANSPKDTENLIQIVGDAPLVVKLLEGTQGKGVVLAETSQAADSVIGAFRGLKANFLIQEFVEEAAGVDIRCFVIGGRVVAAMKRQAADTDFRSNLHQGGKATAVKISKEERAIAAKAAKVIGLNVAGVDLLRSDAGPKVLEVNSSPGISGIEKASGKGIAELIIEYVEKNARPAAPRVRRKTPAAARDDSAAVLSLVQEAS